MALVKLRGAQAADSPAAVVSDQHTWATWLLFSITVLVLWLTRSTLPADYDAVNYVLGVQHFNLELHQPHPPGAPIFMALGKLGTHLGLDALSALLALSALGGGLLVATWHRIFLLLLPAHIALFGAVAVALTPAVWLSSTQPMSDTLAAAGVSVTIWLVLRYWQERRELLVMGAAVAAALTVGVRPQLGLFVLVALVLSTFVVRLPVKTALKAVLVFAAANFVWLIPATVIQARLSGGDLFAYFHLVASFGDEFSVASDSPVLASSFELMQVWKRALMHLGTMGYFGAGLGVWYPEVVAERMASLGTRLTPFHADLLEWSVAGSALFALYAIGFLMALYRFRRLFQNPKVLFLVLFAALYAVSVLSLVPPHTRFYLPLMPLLIVVPLIGFARLRTSRVWCTAFLALQLGSVVSVALDSRGSPPPPMALAGQLAEYRKSSDVQIHALLDSNGSRHVQWMLPDVVLHESLPESMESWVALLDQGGRVFSNAIADVDDLHAQFDVVAIGEYRRPFRVWMRHTGTTLYEIKPRARTESKI